MSVVYQPGTYGLRFMVIEIWGKPVVIIVSVYLIIIPSPILNSLSLVISVLLQETKLP